VLFQHRVEYFLFAFIYKIIINTFIHQVNHFSVLVYNFDFFPKVVHLIEEELIHFLCQLLEKVILA